MTLAEGFTERRQFERFPLLKEAEALVDGTTLGAVIFDITLDGAKIRLTDSELHPENDIAKPISLIIPDAGILEGRVIWTDDEYVGIRFDENQKTMLNLVLEGISG